MVKYIFFGFCLWGLNLSSPAYAQQPDSVLYRIEMKDGNIFFGHIVSENELVIVFQTEEVGEVKLQKNRIKSIRAIDDRRLKDGEYWFRNPHATRYLFGTNGIGLGKGEGYYQNTWVFFNNVNYGITKNFSLGGGIIPTFLFGTTAIPMWIIPKVSIPVVHDNLHLAVGGIFGGVLGEGESIGLGIAYGVVTYGNADDNLTFGMGYGYADGTWADTPIFTLNGMHRFKSELYLITENYVVMAEGDVLGAISIALRWSPENFAVDFGLVRPTDVEGEFIGAPWLGVTIPFGR